MALNMGLWQKILSPWKSGHAEVQAAVSTKESAASRPASVKVPKGQQSNPIYITSSAVSSGQPISRPDRRLINTDITSYRKGSDTYSVVRDFATVTPDLSASVDAYIRTVLTPRYTAVAMNTDGTFNVDATTALQTLLTTFNVLRNYDEGFSNTGSIRSVSESLVKEARYYGAMALELVLDKAGVPVKLQPVSVSTVEFAVDGDGLKPRQKVDNQTIDLDIPTFLYRAIDQDLLTPYSSSPLEAALQPVLFLQEFMNDLRRIVRQAIHPRIKVVLDSEAIIKATPEGQQEYTDSVIKAVADRINGLSPEDALVYLDTVEVQYLTAGNISHDTEMTALKNIIDGKIATGAKTLPSILGQGSSSSNIASTESLLFMKSAEGVQFALNDLLSQALTLAVRLLGYDVYVKFAYDRIDLRPDSELEAFKTMQQSRILQLLSLGLISDEEASLTLTGQLPQAGAAKLSGTRFMKDAGSSIVENPYSNTSSSTLNQNLNSDAPKNAKSQNKGRKGNS